MLRSVLSPGVRVNSYCEVEYSILMPNVEIGRYSRIRRAIIDTGVKIPESSVDRLRSRSRTAPRGYTVTESGIVVVPSRVRAETGCLRLRSAIHDSQQELIRT